MTEFTSVGQDLAIKYPITTTKDEEIPFPKEIKIHRSLVAWDESEADDEEFHYYNPS